MTTVLRTLLGRVETHVVRQDIACDLDPAIEPRKSRELTSSMKVVRKVVVIDQSEIGVLGVRIRHHYPSA